MESRPLPGSSSSSFVPFSVTDTSIDPSTVPVSSFFTTNIEFPVLKAFGTCPVSVVRAKKRIGPLGDDDDDSCEVSVKQLAMKFRCLISEKERFPDDLPLRPLDFGCKYNPESLADDLRQLMKMDHSGDPDINLSKLAEFKAVSKHLDLLSSDRHPNEPKRLRFLRTSVVAGLYFACLMKDDNDFCPRSYKEKVLDCDKILAMDFITIGDILRSTVKLGEFEAFMSFLIDSRICVKLTLALSCTFPIVFHKWSSPPEHSLTISTKGVFNIEDILPLSGPMKRCYIGSMGIIFRNADGSVESYVCSGFDSCPDTTLVELAAVIQGLDIALRRGYRDIIVESESEVVWSLFDGSVNDDKEPNLLYHPSFVSYGKHLMSSFDSLQVVHRLNKGKELSSAEFLALKGRKLLVGLLKSVEHVRFATHLWVDVELTSKEKTKFEKLLDAEKKNVQDFAALLLRDARKL